MIQRDGDVRARVGAGGVCHHELRAVAVVGSGREFAVRGGFDGGLTVDHHLDVVGAVEGVLADRGDDDLPLGFGALDGHVDLALCVLRDLDGRVLSVVDDVDGRFSATLGLCREVDLRCGGAVDDHLLLLFGALGAVVVRADDETTVLVDLGRHVALVVDGDGTVTGDQNRALGTVVCRDDDAFLTLAFDAGRRGDVEADILGLVRRSDDETSVAVVVCGDHRTAVRREARARLTFGVHRECRAGDVSHRGGLTREREAGVGFDLAL